MSKIAYFLFISVIVVSTTGCPTRRYIPDPVPPEPQASTNEDNIGG